VKLHYKKEMQYLNAVADYLTSLGYEVEKPTTEHRDLLDVWGICDGRKCFIEIYVTIHECNAGLVGYWMQGDNEPEEAFLHSEHGLDTRFLPLCILDNLKPLDAAA
jgi:hypothetical protein